MSIFSPHGFTLIRKDGTEHNKIRADLITEDNLVIEEDGIHFTATHDYDSSGFLIYREDYRVCHYKSDGE